MLPFRILYQFPDALHRLYPDAFWRGDADDASVYLTFDDGPVPQVTPYVLDILDKFEAKATFFWVGENVMRSPDLAREVVMRGHCIGNHTHNHLSGWKTPTEQYLQNIQTADCYIQRTLQELMPKVRLFRPPYGRMRRDAYRRLIQDGFQIALWDLVTHDYDRRYTPLQIEQIVRRYVRNGSVLLFHDSLKSRDNTLAVLPCVLQELKDGGYKFQLLYNQNL